MDTPSRSTWLRKILPRSLRWRLQLWLSALLVCVVTAFGITVYQLLRTTRFNQVDRALGVRVAALGKAVREARFVRRDPPLGGMERDAPRPGGPKSPAARREPPPEPPAKGPREPLPGEPPPDGPGPPEEPGADPSGFVLPSETVALFGGAEADYYYSIWHRNSLLNSSPGVPPETPAPAVSEWDTLLHWRFRGSFREVFHCSGFGDCVLAGRSIERDRAALHSLAWVLMVAGGALLVIGLGAGYWSTGRAMRPIDRIAESAARISRGDLSERIATGDSDDELGTLAEVLNKTFARLEAAFARERQFTADAAHELRTPLAVIIAETQMALSRRRSAEEYRDSVKVCLDVAQQMRRLTESLLVLARLDSGETAGAVEPVALEAVAGAVVERAKPLAEQHRVHIACWLEPAVVDGNTERFGQVITNLVTNAVEYNREGGEVNVETYTDWDTAVLKVADTGAGIASADLPRIFERFFRVDKARSRAEGHFGLGLAITKAIVEAAGGSITVTSVPGQGTTFEVRLPAHALQTPADAASRGAAIEPTGRAGADFAPQPRRSLE